MVRLSGIGQRVLDDQKGIEKVLEKEQTRIKFLSELLRKHVLVITNDIDKVDVREPEEVKRVLDRINKLLEDCRELKKIPEFRIHAEEMEHTTLLIKQRWDDFLIRRNKPDFKPEFMRLLARELIRYENILDVDIKKLFNRNRRIIGMIRTEYNVRQTKEILPTWGSVSSVVQKLSKDDPAKFRKIIKDEDKAIELLVKVINEHFVNLVRNAKWEETDLQKVNTRRSYIIALDTLVDDCKALEATGHVKVEKIAHEVGKRISQLSLGLKRPKAFRKYYEHFNKPIVAQLKRILERYYMMLEQSMQDMVQDKQELKRLLETKLEKIPIKKARAA